jgi:hypothetical protein
MPVEPRSESQPKSASSHIWARRISFCLAGLCWFACLPLALLTALFVFDSGPHGSFSYVWIMFGFLTLLSGGVGWLFYFAGRAEDKDSHSQER